MAARPALNSAQPLLRTLTADDLPAAQRWVHQAGWNQTPQDWLRLLDYQPEGCFVATLDGRPVGSVTTTCYGTGLAWIGMMLVDRNDRGRGIATALMRHSIAYLQQCGVRSIYLDATDQGRPVYERLGFQPRWSFHRWEGSGRAEADAGSTMPRPLVQTTAQQAVVNRAALALDCIAFGADRADWLQRLAKDSVVVSADDGYGMLRPGRLASYLGPVTADNDAAAKAIVRQLVQRARGPIFWDVPSPNRAAQRLAQSLGFQPVRSLLRMAIGEAEPPPRLTSQFAFADPATG